MDLGEPKPNAEEADRVRAELKRLYEAGDITEKEFDEQLKRSMIQDEGGLGWGKAHKSGEWHYADGRFQVRGTASGPAPPPPNQNGPTQPRRGTGLMVLLALLGLVVVGAAGAGTGMLLSDNTDGTSSESVNLTTGGSTASQNANSVSNLEGRAIGEAAQKMKSDLVGTNIGEAARIAGGNYKLKVLRLERSTQPKGTIINTFGPTTDEPDAITLILSGGQGSVVVPDVSGLSALQAGEVLIDAGLAPSVTVIFDSSGNPEAAIYRTGKDVTATPITDTFPKAGSLVEAATTIALFS